MNQNVVIETENISFSYEPGEQVLDNISTKLYAGEKIAVLGANGAGKSTFFLCLNGVLRPSSGSIRLLGSPVDGKARELRRHVGIVFQDPDSQIIAPSVEAEISFGPVNLKLLQEEIRKRTQEAAACMDLIGLLSRPPHYLSGGEKKRVTIAGILAMEPELLLFDEPSASLDAQSREALEEILLKLHREGRTIAVSTHDVDFAYRFADRILVFCEGRIIADGAPGEVFADEAVLKKAHIRPPVLFTLYEQLIREKKLTRREGQCAPVTAEELAALL